MDPGGSSNIDEGEMKFLIPISYIAVTNPCIVEFPLVAVKRLLNAGAVIIPDMTP